MINNKTVIAVIPARGGSKRLKNKNIKHFHGKPLIQWTIDAALGCKYIDTIVVSSDSDEIIDKVHKDDVEIHKREKRLSDDSSKSIDVAVNVLKKYENFDILVWLQPTSPLRNSVHIKEAIELFSSVSNKSLVSVGREEHSPLLINKLDGNGNISNFLKNNIQNVRAQDDDGYYKLNGAIYINDIKTILEKKTFIFPDTKAYVMPSNVSIDIDTELDFKLAELLYRKCDI